MEYSELDEKLEAILFAVGDPSSLDDLMLACGADRRTVRGALDYLEKRLNITGGIRLLRLDGKYQLATKERFADNVKIALNTKRLVPITAAAAEVLAIIAYNQPVTKGFVERVREVNSDSVVNSLAEKELIEEAGRLPLPGRPMTYRTTSTFLRSFGISSLDELPEPPRKLPPEYTGDLLDNSENYEENETSEEFDRNA